MLVSCNDTVQAQILYELTTVQATVTCGMTLLGGHSFDSDQSRADRLALVKKRKGQKRGGGREWKGKGRKGKESEGERVQAPTKVLPF